MEEGKEDNWRDDLMAYSTDHITKVEAWTAADYDADDLVLDADVTTCMTNATTGEDCDEWKEGILNGRIEIDIPPSAVTALKVRFYFNSVMTAGDNALLPYTDANSVSITNEVIKDYTTPGQWIEHVVDASFLAELGDLGNKFAVRLASGELGTSGSAKSKLGEVEIDITFTQPVLTGITKDKDGVALGSCECAIFQRTEASPNTYEWIASTTSHVTTGAYSFDVWGGNYYMVYASKDDSPHVFDATDHVLEADP